MSFDELLHPYERYLDNSFFDIVNIQSPNFERFIENFENNWRAVGGHFGLPILKIEFLERLDKKERLRTLFHEWMYQKNPTLRRMSDILKDIGLISAQKELCIMLDNFSKNQLHQNALLTDYLIKREPSAGENSNNSYSFQWSLVEVDGKSQLEYTYPTAQIHFTLADAPNSFHMGGRLFPFPTLVGAIRPQKIMVYLSYSKGTRDRKLRIEIIDYEQKGKKWFVLHSKDRLPTFSCKQKTCNLLVEDGTRVLFSERILLKKDFASSTVQTKLFPAIDELAEATMQVQPNCCPLETPLYLDIETNTKFCPPLSAYFVEYWPLVNRRVINIIGKQPCYVDGIKKRTQAPIHTKKERAWVGLVDADGVTDFTPDFWFKNKQPHDEIAVILIDIAESFEEKLFDTKSNIQSGNNNNNNNNNLHSFDSQPTDAMHHPVLSKALLNFMDSPKFRRNDDNSQGLKHHSMAFSQEIYKKMKLHEAVIEGVLWRVQECIEQEIATINLKQDGLTPLHYAAFFNRIDIVEYLLKKGALVDVVDDENFETALHKAVLQQHLEICSLLLIYGASMDIQNKDNQTPEDFANTNLFSLHQLKDSCLLSPSTLPAQSNACLRIQDKLLTDFDKEPEVIFGNQKGLVIRFAPPVTEVLCPFFLAGSVEITLESDKQTYRIPIYPVIQKEEWEANSQCIALNIMESSKKKLKIDYVLFPDSKRLRQDPPVPNLEDMQVVETNFAMIDYQLTFGSGSHTRNNSIGSIPIQKETSEVIAKFYFGLTKQWSFIVDTHKSGKRETFTLARCIAFIGNRWLPARLGVPPILYQRLYRILGKTSFQNAISALLRIQLDNSSPEVCTPFPVEKIRGQRLYLLELAMRRAHATQKLKIIVDVIDSEGNVLETAVNLIVIQKSKPPKSQPGKTAAGLDLVELPKWLQSIVSSGNEQK